MQKDQQHSVPVAVVGVSAIFPGSTSARGFWRDIVGKTDRLSDVPPTHWLIEDYYDPDPKAPDKTYGRRGGFIPDTPFDPMAFGIPPNQLEATDSSQLLALLVAKQVLEDAYRGQFSTADKSRISVVLGTTGATELILDMASRMERPKWIKSLREEGLDEETAARVCDRIAAHYAQWQESSFPGLLPNVVAGRIAHKLDLGGTNYITDAACASSFAALNVALNELYLRQSDLVITGGVDTLNTISMFMCFSKTPALSPTGDCRPFSEEADGTMLGEGLGMVALKRLDDAERDGDLIYAVIRGLGASSDGKSSSVYAPLPEGQARALRRAYANAGYAPGDVELIEAHGTATRAGDAAELEGLNSVFGPGTQTGVQSAPRIALGSVKSNIGHTKAAAGVAGLIKVALALQHKILPPTIKVKTPAPRLGQESCVFYLNTEARPWIRGAGRPRRAGVSSFGFGGTNFHVALEEYAGGPQGRGVARPRWREFNTELFLFSAPTRETLQAACLDAANAIQGDERAFRLLATAGQRHFDADKEHRLALIATDAADLRRKLDQAVGMLGLPEVEAFALPSGVYYDKGPKKGKLGFLFPGQGSQYLNMSAEAAMAFDTAREAWDQIAELDLWANGPALHEMVFPPPATDDSRRELQEARLRETQWAQPAIANASVSLLRLLQALGLRPDACAGHSLGELTALHAAGAFDHETLIAVARRRGELMKEAASGSGAMLAVKGSPGLIESRLREWKSAATIANYNAPEQTVLAGTAEEVAGIKERLEAENFSCAALPVATAFHSEIVAPAARPFQEFLEGVAFRPTALPVYANLDGAPYPDSPAEARRRLGEQLFRPVRFADQIERMYADGVRVFVEVGPQAVLTGLTDSILDGRERLTIALDRKGQDGVPQFWRALARLAVAGFALDFGRLLEGYEIVEPPPARPTSSLRVSINGANYAKPYPPKGGAAGLPKPNPAPEPPDRIVTAQPPPQFSQPPSTPNGDAPPQGAIPPPPAGAALPVPPADWIAAFQQAQRQTLEAHSQFQRLMAESHQAFLKAAEQSLMSLTSLVGGFTPAMSINAQGAAGGASEQAVSAGSAAPTDYAQPTYAPPPIPPIPPIPFESVERPVNGVAPAAAVDTFTKRQPGLNGQQNPGSQLNLDQLLLGVVSEKTGYPAEMLNLDMEFDNDLGVDSIKRVEIFATLMEQSPELQGLDTSELAKLATLGQITNYVREHLHVESPGQGQPTARPNSNKTKPEMATTTVRPGDDSRQSSIGRLDVAAIMLRVVSEKTGYPAEMLNLDMEFDNDLGVDSIKRVEIFATLMEQSPELQGLDTSELAKLATLGQITNYVQKRLQPQEEQPAISEAEAYRPPTAEIVPIGTVAPTFANSDTVDAVAGGNSTVNSVAASPIVERFAVEWVAAPAMGWGPADLRPGARVVLFDDSAGVARALADRLTADGMNVHLADAESAQDLSAENLDADAVVYLGGLAPAPDYSEAMAIQREAFRISRAIAPRFTERGGVFILVHDSGGLNSGGRGSIEKGAGAGLNGEQASERAWLGGLAALAKTAALEWPLATVKSIDLECDGRFPDTLADEIADEIFFGGMEREVGLSADGTRKTLVGVARPAEGTTATRLAPGAVIVVSGGARGVTAASLLALAETIRPRLAILGRTALEEDPPAITGLINEGDMKRALLAEALSRGESLSPAALNERVRRASASREVRATLRELKAAGAEVRYVVVDIRAAQSVRAALDRVRAEWGPIEGLVHSAGVIADKRIAEKKDEQFDLVFSTKADGLRALLEATAEDPLRSIALFSSVAARTGNPGQCDYAMGNETLNKVAAYEYARRQGACLVKSINWGPWDGGMVSPQLKTRFAESGVPLIPLATGARMFVEEFLGDSPGGRNGEVEIVIGGRPAGATIQGTAPVRSELTATVSARNFVFLKGHRIKGETVVPFALVHEWFYRVCQSARPDLRVVEIRDFKALKGIVLRDFEGAGESFTINLTPTLFTSREADFNIELRGHGGALHYQAVAALRESVGRAERVPREPAIHGPRDEERAGWPLPLVYDGEVLFHRGAFKVIRAINGVDSKGIEGELAPREGWDPAASVRGGASPAAVRRAILLDGALQLAVLWHWRRVGGGSLPLAIGSVKIYGEFGAGPLRCEIAGRVKSRDLASVDLRLISPSGEVVAEIMGLELVVYFQKEFAAGATQ